MVRRLTTFAMVLLAVACVATIAPRPALADKRVALLIGNAAYAKAAHLANPSNDVAVMKKALTEAGFDIVDAHTDLDRAGMIKALQTFEEAVQGSEIGVIFYSGHGMELNGQNFLIPVDAQLSSDRVVGDEAISLERVLDALDGATRLKLAILDACRDNPFSASMKRSITRGAPSKGLAKVDPVGLRNVLIAYAAAPGQTALDGDGTNSPFTAALAKYLVAPGLDVQLALRKVRDEVGSATGQQQQPYQTGSIGGEILPLSKFAAPGEALPPHADETRAADPEASARADFALAMQVGSLEMWDAFKQKYPSFYPSVVDAERKKLAAPDTGRQAMLQTAPSANVLQAAPVTECDRLAARPSDPDQPPNAPGVEFAQIDAVRAIPACRAALAQYPGERRFMFALGRALQSAKQDDEAVRLYRQAADAGNASAMNNLGTMYRDGRGVAPDETEAVRLFRKAADAGNAFAMNNLAAMYRDGRGVSLDEAEAVRLFRKAADAGNPYAMFELGVMYENGRGVARDEAEALRRFRQAADAGSKLAMFALGVRYETGRGVVRDEAEAVRFFRRAAEAGNTLAMQKLGFMYENGLGVAKDEAEAVRFFRKAAEAGNARAMQKLGFMYENGLGVAKDEAEAVRFFRMAAEAGNVRAMHRLAVMYATGRGVPRDISQAKLWFAKAANLGDEDARRALQNFR
ncbi:MAG: caspase family protein [Beijerinckiaceae bacterium]